MDTITDNEQDLPIRVIQVKFERCDLSPQERSKEQDDLDRAAGQPWSSLEDPIARALRREIRESSGAVSTEHSEWFCLNEDVELPPKGVHASYNHPILTLSRYQRRVSF